MGLFVEKIGGVPNAVRQDFINEKARGDAQCVLNYEGAVGEYCGELPGV